LLYVLTNFKIIVSFVCKCVNTQGGFYEQHEGKAQYNNGPICMGNT